MVFSHLVLLNNNLESDVLNYLKNVVGRYVGIGTTHNIVYIILHPHYIHISHTK